MSRSRYGGSLPLERKLPLLISALLLLVLVVASGAAYLEVRRSAELTAETRLLGAGRQLAEVLQRSMGQQGATLRRVLTDTAVRALVDGDETATPRALAALRRFAPGSDSAVVARVWDAAGREMVGLGAMPDADRERAFALLRANIGKDALAIGPLYRHGDSVFFLAVGAVVGRRGGRGTVANRVHITAQPGADRQIRGLIGDEITVFLQNVSGDVRTTLGGIPSTPSSQASAMGTALGTLVRDRVARSFMTLVPVKGTPWALYLEMPSAAVLARPNAFLRRMALIAALLVVSGAALAWIGSRRVIRPLADLTAATAAVARGDYGQRVAVRAPDELGRLATSFNTMAERVAEALDALRTSNAELERQTKDAEAARREAVAASKAKSDFLAVMSHELRTPLNAILGFSSLLLDGIAGPLVPAQRQQVARIHGGGQHLLALIDEILALSRIEAGREEVRVDTGDAFVLAREVAAFAAPMVTGAGLRLSTRISDGPCVVHTDLTKLRQILINLISNAVKFTPTGEVTLAAECDASRVTFRVHDTGVGIDPALVSHIFEPFYQADQSRTRRVSGIGLGLTVARRMARLLGGDITVHTATGAGSTFTVTAATIAPVAQHDPFRSAPHSQHAQPAGAHS